jgi:uncharacterized protein YbbK (DUF523 family)
METLGRRFEWIPVCPEVEMGLGVPRGTLRLEGDPGRPRLIFERSRADLTRRMRDWARSRLDDLARQNLCGYVLKSGSPSCGLERVPVHWPAGGRPLRSGTGLFTRALMERFPHLPVEEEAGLRDGRRRARFIERVLSYRGGQADSVPEANRRGRGTV